MPVASGEFSQPQKLQDGAAVRLLKDVVLLPAAEATTKISNAEPETQELVRSVLKQRAIDKSETWKFAFGERPGRATIARIARRLEIEVHPFMGMVNYSALRECWSELRALRSWYRPGRKQSRRHRGIRRDHGGLERVVGRATVWNKQFARYFRYLLRLRAEGGRRRVSATLRGHWRWRSIAIPLRVAGMSVQSGTVPVERVWSSMLQMFSDCGRTMSMEL